MKYHTLPQRNEKRLKRLVFVSTPDPKAVASCGDYIFAVSHHFIVSGKRLQKTNDALLFAKYHTAAPSLTQRHRLRSPCTVGTQHTSRDSLGREPT